MPTIKAGSDATALNRIRHYIGVRACFFASMFFAIASIAAFVAGAPGIRLDCASTAWLALLTFPLAHLNLAHLAGNVFGMLLAGSAADHIVMSWKKFALVVLITGWMSPLPLICLFPSITFMGISGAIYGAFGSMVARVRKYDKASADLFLTLTVMILAFGCLSATSFQSKTSTLLASDAHFLGFAVGIVLGCVLRDKKHRYSKKTIVALRYLYILHCTFSRLNGQHASAPFHRFQKLLHYYARIERQERVC